MHDQILMTEIQHEKVELEIRERIGSFHKGDLNHIKTVERVVLPSEEGTQLLASLNRFFASTHQCISCTS